MNVWGTWRWRALAVVAAIALVGGAGVGSIGAHAATDPLSADSLMSTVHDYVSLGSDHLTGTPAEARTQTWLTAQLKAAGARTGSDAYTFGGFRPTAVDLTLHTAALTPIPGVIASFYSGVTGPDGVTARLIDAGNGVGATKVKINVSGRIAVVEVPQVDGVSATFATAFNLMEQGGAVGLIVVTDGPENYPVHQDVDSRGGVHSLPTLIVGRRIGQSIISAADDGVQATLTLTAKLGRACDTDVWGVLPGSDPDRFIVVGTPTSAFVKAASERGAGVAALVALARAYGALPREQRPVGLVFAGLSGHEVGYLGLPILMQTHPDWFSMADAYVHLGASIAAVAMLDNSSGPASPLGFGDPTRALYVSENPVLQQAALRSFGTTEAQIPPSLDDPGEQSVAYAAGVPIVGESGSSEYFHTAGDLENGVGPALLADQATAWRQTIDAIAATAPHQVRGANLVAQALRSARPAATGPAGSGLAGSGSATATDADEPTPVASCTTPVALQPPSPATPPPSPGIATYEDAQPGYAWEGSWQERPVTWTSTLTQSSLSGVVFAPATPPKHPVPAVVIVPGSGPGVQSFYQWAARDLAGHGYVALTVDPQGVGQSGAFGTPPCGSTGPGQETPCAGVPFQQDANYVDAVESGIDLLVSDANPYRREVDIHKIGAAGHSLAARAVSYAQGVDPRIGAVVAWDNLASDLNGDAGSASGGPPLGNLIGGELPGQSVPVTPRAPALGEASDSAFNTNPDVKKTAFADWRSQKVATMEVVFAGAVHTDWAQSSRNTTTGEAALRRFEHYTRAWLDLWLRGDSSALDRLTTTSIAGVARADYLSTKFRSALYVPAKVDIPDLRGG
ncbi:MAG: hypothetical protein ACYDH6_07510 [Acidimicrobiales bacterium]